MPHRATVWRRSATCPNCREELDWDALALLHRRKAKARRTRGLGSFVAKLTSTAQHAASSRTKGLAARTGQENAPPPGAHAPLGGAHAPFAVAHAPLAVAHAPLGDRLLRLVGAGAVSPPAKLTRRPRRARSTPSAASSAPDAAEAIDEADAWPRRLRRAESDEP